MLIRDALLSSLGAVSLFVVAAASSIGGCSSASTDAADSGAADTGPATCASPGKATPGAASTHCQGRPAQTVSAASCMPDASAPGDQDAGDAGEADAGMTAECEWGPTQFGQEGDDDDCKYHVSWTSSPLCEGGGGVTFTVKIVNKADGKPVTGIPMGVITEAFIPTDPAATCDNMSTHPSPSAPTLVETAAGSGVYAGNIAFDAPGDWTVRFHIHEECADLLEDSPHGHVAFRVTLP